MSDVCKCVSCSACGGTGSIWVDFRGRYLGNYRSDDLDEMDICDECGGSGTAEVCDHCMDLGDAEDNGQ